MSHFHRKYVLQAEAEEGQDGGGGEAETVKNESQAGEAAQPTDAEVKARKMGWVPKEEFRGDPEKWRPADEFVERGETMVPLLRSQVKKQEREIAELRATMQQFAEYHSKTEQRAHERALADLKQARAAAIAAGDGAAFAQVDDQIEELKDSIKTKPPAKQNDAENPAFVEWLSRNQWAHDVKLQNIGRGIAEALVAEGETATGTELLDLVTKEIKQRYPEKFENPRRNSAPPVEGSGSAPRKSGKSYSDLPPEAKAACDRFVKQKLTTKEEYVKRFFED